VFKNKRKVDHVGSFKQFFGPELVGHYRKGKEWFYRNNRFETVLCKTNANRKKKVVSFALEKDVKKGNGDGHLKENRFQTFFPAKY